MASERKCASCSRPAAENRKCCERCLDLAKLRAKRVDPAVKRERRRMDYQRHKDAYKAQAREWAAANPERRLEIQNQWKRDNPERERDSRVAAKANARARALGIEGVLTVDSRNEMIARWGDACLACGKSEVTLDHVVPLGEGGLNTVDNLQPLCLDCNRAKSTKIIDYRVAV